MGTVLELGKYESVLCWGITETQQKPYYARTKIKTTKQKDVSWKLVQLTCGGLNSAFSFTLWLNHAKSSLHITLEKLGRVPQEGLEVCVRVFLLVFIQLRQTLRNNTLWMEVLNRELQINLVILQKSEVFTNCHLFSILTSLVFSLEPIFLKISDRMSLTLALISLSSYTNQNTVEETRSATTIFSKHHQDEGFSWDPAGHTDLRAPFSVLLSVLSPERFAECLTTRLRCASSSDSLRFSIMDMWSNIYERDIHRFLIKQVSWRTFRIY